MAFPSPDRVQRDAGRRIAELRRSRHLTQQELADRLDVSIRYVQRVEAGEKNLTVRFLAELAPILRAQVVDFFSPPSTRKVTRGRPPKDA